jgi:hypothetical protein
MFQDMIPAVGRLPNYRHPGVLHNAEGSDTGAMETMEAMEAINGFKKRINGDPK